MEHVENQVIAILVNFRKMRGLSQKVVARRIGIAPANLCKYEFGKIKPGLDLLLSWCEALNCSLIVAPRDWPYDFPR